MKRSLLAIVSLILMCIMVLTSCNTTAPENVSTEDADASASIIEDAKLDAEIKAEPEVKEEAEPVPEPEVIPEEEEIIPEEEPEVEVKVEIPEESEDNTEVLPEEEPEEPTVDPEDEPEEAVLEIEIDLESQPQINNAATVKYKDNIPAAKNYTGVMHYPTTDGSKISCNVDFVVDYKMLIDGDNKTYSKDLAKLAVLYASDIYSGLYVQFKTGTTGGSDTTTNFGKKVGLNDVKSYKINASDYAVDKDDVTEFFVGHKKIVYKGVIREIIVVAVRGTNETNAEWSSNFDVGADTREYYTAMGNSHPHWVNKNNHKGFDVASNRVYEKLQNYISTYVASDAEVSMLVTGHSRGAAIANILSQMYEDNTDYRVYGYTFAAPNTTTAKNAASYKNIFNIVNEDDIIPYLPLSQWGFTKYGVTKTISVNEYYDYEPGLFGKDKEGAFKWFTGKSYNDDGGTDRTLACFAALATCREDLYKLDTTSHGKMTYTGLLGLKYNQKDATAKYNEIVAKLKAEKLYQFCKVSIVKSGTKYYVEVVYAPAFFMQMLANMTTGVGDLLGYSLGTKYNDAKLSFVASSGKAVVGGMEHPHMQPTYYLIVRNDFKAI